MSPASDSDDLKVLITGYSTLDYRRRKQHLKNVSLSSLNLDSMIGKALAVELKDGNECSNFKNVEIFKTRNEKLYKIIKWLILGAKSLQLQSPNSSLYHRTFMPNYDICWRRK